MSDDRHVHPPVDDRESFTDLARRVDDLRARVARQGGEAKALLDETIEAITDFNRVGLASLVSFLRRDPAGVELLYRAVDAPEVMALLVAHGIVRADLTLDVLRVVEQLRPYLVASSVDVEVVRVEGGTAYLRYHGSPPSEELDDGLRQAMLTRVPGLRAVERADDGAAFVPLSSIQVRRP